MERHHFNPRTPCGVRHQPGHVFRTSPTLFQSTHPVRGATGASPNAILPPAISIHAPRAGCDDNTRLSTSSGTISIHAPRAGCDAIARTPCHQLPDISIHAPRAGCDHILAHKVRHAVISIHAHRAGCDGKFDDFNPLNLHKRYKRVLDRPKSTSEQGKNKAKLAYIHVFTVLGGCEGAGTVCALLLRTQYC